MTGKPIDWVEDELSHWTGSHRLQWRSFFLGFQLGRIPPPLTETNVRATIATYLRGLGHHRRKTPPTHPDTQDVR